MEDKNISISTTISKFSLFYSHKDIHSWLTSNFGELSSPAHEVRPHFDRLRAHKVEFRYSMLFALQEVTSCVELPVKKSAKWTDHFGWKISVKLCNISTLMRLSTDFLFGFNNITFDLDGSRINSKGKTSILLKKSSSVSHMLTRDWNFLFRTKNNLVKKVTVRFMGTKLDL